MKIRENIDLLFLYFRVPFRYDTVKKFIINSEFFMNCSLIYMRIFFCFFCNVHYLQFSVHENYNDKTKMLKAYNSYFLENSTV